MSAGRVSNIENDSSIPKKILELEAGSVQSNQPTSEQRTERVRAAEEEVIRRAQQAANSINPWLREVTTEHARLFVETLNKSLWRIPQDDSVFSTELGKIDGCDVERKMKIEETEPKTLSKPSSPQNGLSSLETRDVELASKTSQSIATHCPQQPSNLSSHRHKTQQPREADEEALSNNSFEPKMTSSAPEAVPTNFVSPKNSQIHSSHQSNTSSAEAHDTQQNLKELAPAPIFTKAGESRIEAKRGNADWLQKQMESESTKKKSLVLLVLGQTGVGKSTWINALANYLKFQTLDEAMAAEALMCVIPTKLEFCDDNYQRHEVLLGEDENEDISKTTHSVTQSAKSYLCESEDYNLYIIDTPGMNDTRGAEKDDENIQNILQSIAPFKEIHAICFMFKSNESRLTQSFRYSIEKLLGNLSKSALENACFVFTNARGTFYRPGDTMDLLKKYFKDLEDRENLSVKISSQNTFCLDNEAFRFLCAHFSNIQFPASQKKTFADSWSHSAMEVRKLLAHASRIRPHNTSDTLSINDTRTWIEQLIDPILKASSMIQTNIRKLHEQKRDLLNVENHIEYLSTIRVTTMKIIPLKSPQTVCTNVECVDFEIIDEKKVLVYKTVCHEDCRLHLNANLQECQVFGWTKKCKKCGHHIDEHERIKYKQKIFTQSLEAPQKLAQSEAETKKMSINRLESCINTYQKEFSYILFAMAAFSTFLAKKGMAQKINIFDEHLKKLLNDEVTKIKSVPGLNQDEYHQLAALRTEYHQSCRRFAQEHTTEISLQELQDIRQKLFSMPLTGSNISEIFTIHVKVDQQDHEAEVIKCDKTRFSMMKGALKKVENFMEASKVVVGLAVDLGIEGCKSWIPTSSYNSSSSNGYSGSLRF